MYLIMNGYYSDQTPVGVVETKKEAEKVCEVWNLLEGDYWYTEVSKIDVGKPPKAEIVTGWVFEFENGRGISWRVERSMLSNERYILIQDGWKGEYPAIWVPLEDEDKARKTAYEIFYMYKLKQMEGDVTDVAGYKVTRERDIPKEFKDFAKIVEE